MFLPVDPMAGDLQSQVAISAFERDNYKKDNISLYCFVFYAHNLDGMYEK